VSEEYQLEKLKGHKNILNYSEKQGLLTNIIKPWIIKGIDNSRRKECP
jgi:hypothetical protein